MGYVELQVTSNFSFLRGGSHAAEFFHRARELGYDALGVADRNTMSGIVRAHLAARDFGLRLIVGCRLGLEDGPSLLAYPEDRAAYGRLCRLLTTGNLRAEKGACRLFRADLEILNRGLQLVAVPPAEADQAFETALAQYKELFGDSLSLAAAPCYDGSDTRRFNRLAALSTRCNVPLAASNDVHYHHPSRRALQDVLVCIREKCTIETAGFRLFAHAERHLKSPQEMENIFTAYPSALRRTREIAEACRFSLEELRYEYPDEITTEGRTPQQELEYLTWEGARWRFPGGIPPQVKALLDKELDFIAEVNFAPFFLTVYDVVRYARAQKILCQGRGSAANSVVCYCLGITSVNPEEIDVLFERFISSARNQPPDIDVDFEHERREEVIQYIYEKYGRNRAGIVATVSSYRSRGSIRDVGKALGLSADAVERLAETAEEEGAADPQLQRTLKLAEELEGFPRHLSQHVGGFVITRGELAELCPVMNAAMDGRTTIEWDKDDIDALGFLKVDVLSLGMLTCLRKAFELCKKHYGRDFTLAGLPRDDAPTYDMICKADTVGVFQIESRAQMSMLPRLKPRSFYDLVIEVAIVRPGPIQGDMVHPYLKRRNRLEKPDIPPGLERILEKTFGVPLFQEQAMNVAIVGAGFTPAEADQLRRAMATFKSVGTVTQLKEKLISGMVNNKYSLAFAERCYKMLEGFGHYGFPESHAAAFAQLAYASAWLKCHYPDVFACALLNSQPMGFYAPAQIVGCARAHGVEVRAADVNHSAWDHQLEERAGNIGSGREDINRRCALRLGFRLIGGLAEKEFEKVAKERENGPYADIGALRRRAHLSLAALETLAEADAFRSLGLDRRAALWEVRALSKQPAPLLAAAPGEALAEPAPALPALSLSEHVVQDYAATALSLKAHPVSFLRERLTALNAVPARALPTIKHGTAVKIAGLVLVRQRPPTAGGVLFMTIEDETGSANLVVFRKTWERWRRPILRARLILAEGRLERDSGVIHVIADHLHDLSPWLQSLAREPGNLPLLPEDSLPGARNFR
jgi:error-prone DNA polymerase